MIRCLIISLLLFPAAIFSEEKEIPDQIHINPDLAVKMALENNLYIKIAGVKIESKNRSRKSVWNNFIPEISTSMVFSNPNEVLPGYEDQWSVRLGLDMSLRLNAGLIYGIKYTGSEYKKGKIDFEAARSNIEKNVKKLFLDLLLMKEKNKLMEETLKAAGDRFRKEKINYENGQSSEYDMLRAQVGYESMKPELDSLKIAYSAMTMNFKQILGVPRKTAIFIDGKIEIEKIFLDSEILISKYLSNSLDIKSLIQSLEALKNQKRGLMLAYWSPTFAMGYDRSPSFMGDAFGDSWIKNRKDNWYDSGKFYFSFSMYLDALIPRSKKFLEILNTKDAMKIAELNLTRALQEAEIKIETEVMKLENYWNSIGTLELNEKVAEKAYNMAKEGYYAGSIDLLEMQDAELRLKKAKLGVLEGKSKYLTGLLNIEYFLNVSLDNLKKNVTPE